jgi:hypothetical protein
MMIAAPRALLVAIAMEIFLNETFMRNLNCFSSSSSHPGVLSSSSSNSSSLHSRADLRANIYSHQLTLCIANADTTFFNYSRKTRKSKQKFFSSLVSSSVSSVCGFHIIIFHFLHSFSVRKWQKRRGANAG